MEEKIFAMALGLQPPWEIQKIDFDEQNGILNIEVGLEEKVIMECPICGKPSKIRDKKTKTWRHLDFFQHQCYLHAKVPRINCDEHGVHLVNVPWSTPRSGFTQLFEYFAMLLVKEMPVNAAARLLRIHDTKLWRIVRNHIDGVRSKADYGKVTQVGMDETSIKPKHNYVSLFVDLAEKKVLYGTVGNTHEAVREFVEDLISHGGSPDKIKDVSCDLWGGFTKGTREYLKKAEITYDRFHLVKKVNEAMDQVRKTEGRKNKELKGLRYLFLKNPANLTEEEIDKLKPLRHDNAEISRAYNLKLKLLDVYNCPDFNTALEFLDDWSDWAQRSRLRPFVLLARTVRKHKSRIARWHITHISNAILEGINSLVQAAKNKARGYRNPHNFISISYLVAGKLDLALHTN